MQPYFDPTRWNMEDDLYNFKTEDNFTFLLEMEDDHIFVSSNVGAAFF